MDDAAYAKLERLDQESRSQEHTLIRLDGRVGRLETVIGGATPLSSQTEGLAWKLALLIGGFGIVQTVVIAVAIAQMKGG